MAGKYKCTNVKFNISDPVQAEAYEYLKVHKGDRSYGKIISEAIMAIRNEDHPSINHESVNPNGQFSLKEDDITRLAKLIADNILLSGYHLSGPLPDPSTELNDAGVQFQEDGSLSEAMAAFAFE